MPNYYTCKKAVQKVIIGCYEINYIMVTSSLWVSQEKQFYDRLCVEVLQEDLGPL